MKSPHVRRTPGILIGLLVASIAVGPVRAEHDAEAPPEQSEEELAKKTQNPVADLISVPFQSNFNFNTGPREKTVTC